MSGCTQYIAQDAEDFVRKGLAVCADLDGLAALRAGLRDKFALPLGLHDAQIADGVERALRMMWQRWCDGLPAASFENQLRPRSRKPRTNRCRAAADLRDAAGYMPPLADFVASLEQIWDSKFLTNGGQFHQRLEQALCEHLGVEHISLFANGTLALMTALQALGIEGEVITTPYSFVATSHACCGTA
jgi:hypothetical protein